jgi:hypothetical protein
MTTLAQRMRAAADILEELSALYGYRHPDETDWSAKELRAEAGKQPSAAPDYSGCAGACVDLGGDE